MQLGELILRQGLGRKQVQRARVRIFKDRVQHRQVVAQRLAGCRRRNHHNVASLPNGFRCQGLVAIQLRNAFFRINVRQLRAHPFRHGRKPSLARRDMVHGGNDFAAVVALGKLLDNFPDARERDRVLRGPHRQRLSHCQPPPRFAFSSLRYHAAAGRATVFLAERFKRFPGAPDNFKRILPHAHCRSRIFAKLFLPENVSLPCPQAGLDLYQRSCLGPVPHLVCRPVERGFRRDLI